MVSEIEVSARVAKQMDVLILVLVEDGFRDGRFHLPTLLAAMS